MLQTMEQLLRALSQLADEVRAIKRTHSLQAALDAVGLGLIIPVPLESRS